MSTESRIVEPNEKIAILAGGKTFPLKIAKACKDPLVIGISGQTIADLYKEFSYEEIKLGQVGKLLDLLKKNGISTICMIGKIERPSFSDLKLDLKGAQIAAKIGMEAVLGKLGDDGVLRKVRGILEDEGVQVIGAHHLDPEVLLPAGAITVVKPNKQDISDIERGVEVARALGKVDVGQSVIVEHGVVLGVEAIEGTDALIERCKTLKRKEEAGFLIKVIKPGQDPDLDMPVIGLHTLQMVQEAGFKGVAAIAQKTLIADREEAIAFADDKKMVLYGLN